MNKNEIIETIFKSEEYDDLLSKLIERTDLYLEDFKQDLMLILLEKNSKLIEELWNENKMRFYIIRIVTNQIYSSSSPFYNDYKKYYRELIQTTDDNNYYSDYLNNFSETIDNDNTFEEIDEVIDNNILTFINKNSILTWYETNILSIYYKLGEYKDVKQKVSLRTMEKEYGIHYVSLHLTIKESVDKIKSYVENKMKNN